MLLNNEWVIRRLRKKSEDILKQVKIRTQQSKICGTLGTKPKREIHSIRGLLQNKTKQKQKTRESSNKQSNFTLQGT